jgi:hypothetical protein
VAAERWERWEAERQPQRDSAQERNMIVTLYIVFEQKDTLKIDEY